MYVVRKASVGTVLLRNWTTILGIFAVVTAATVLQIHVLHRYLSPSTVAVTVLGIAISFFIGFINSEAYRRWREAREIWGGLVNHSRSFARMVFTFLPESEEDRRRGFIHRHIAFLYSLRDELRGEESDAATAYLGGQTNEALRPQAHMPAAILQLQAEAIHAAASANLIDGFQATQLRGVLASLTNEMGATERIKHTAFPVLYVSMVHLALLIFLLAFPVSASAESGYWAILYGTLLGTIFVLTFRAGQMLLDPFENRPTDVPMSTLTRTVEIELLEALGEDDVPAPLEPTDALYLM